MTEPIPAKLVPVEQPEEGYWWCPECERECPPIHVTYYENHTNCGCRVIWKNRISSTPQREQDGGWEAGFNAGVEAAAVVADREGRACGSHEAASKGAAKTMHRAARGVCECIASTIRRLHPPAPVEQPLTAGQRALARQTYDDEALVGPAPVEQPEAEVREALRSTIANAWHRDGGAVAAADACLSYLINAGWRRK